MPLINVAYATLVLILGFILSKMISRISIKIRRTRRRTINEDSLLPEKIVQVIFLLISMTILGYETPQDLFVQISNIFPLIIQSLLLIIAGVLIINILVWIIKQFILYSKIEEMTNEAIITSFLLIVRIILYILLAQILLSSFDIPAQFLQIILYPLIGIIFFLFSVGLFNPTRDFFSKFYLTTILNFKKGNTLIRDNKEYTIRSINNLFTKLSDNKGRTLIIPNRILASETISLISPTKEIENLESLKEAFVIQHKSYCGPATAQIALALFRIKSTQEDLAKLMGTIKRNSESQKVAGTHPDSLIKTVEVFTKKKVIGAWIDFDKIYHLSQEVKSWLKDGALVIVDYKKKYIFPDASTAHYSLVTAVKGDEFLIVDPSMKSGGVYYSDYRDILTGMNTYSPLIKSKRGYIILAPKNSVAYERIKAGAIYYDPSMYDKLTKDIEMMLNKATNATFISEVISPVLKRISKKNLKKPQISSVWDAKK